MRISKTFWWIVIGIAVLILITSFVKGADPYKIFYEDTNTVAIYNQQDKHLANITLLTAPVEKVGVGYELVAELQFDLFETTGYLIDKIDTFDLHQNGQQVNQTFEVKVNKPIEFEVTNYDCYDINYTNGSSYDWCDEIISYETQDHWVLAEASDFEKDTTLIIGLFTTTNEGDYKDWIPTFAGVVVDEWAGWEAGLNNGLVTYHNLDETSGNVLDAIGDCDAVISGTLYQDLAGNLSYGLTIGSTDGKADFSNVSMWDLTGNFTVNVWFKTNGSSTDTFVGNFIRNDDPSANSYYGWKVGLSDGKAYAGHGTGAPVTQHSDVSAGTYVDNVWYMGTYIRDADADDLFIYINGVSVVNDTSWGATIDYSYHAPSLFSWEYQGPSYVYTDDTTSIDELGVWSRALSESEIKTLWNNGQAITYSSPNNAPNTPILNAPSDDATDQAQIVVLNATVSDPDGDDMNVTFYNATHSAICTNNTNIANNTEVICTWTGLSDFTDYTWYVNATDGTETTMSAIYNFSVGDNTAPTITPPSNSTLEYLEDFFEVDFDADESVTWAVDDTTNFSINATGGLSNNTILDVKTYELIITATDGSSNANTVPYKVIVQDTAPTIYIYHPTEFQNISTNPVFFNASATQSISSWIANWNGTNYTIPINTSLEVLDGTYNLLLWANDTAGTWGLNDSFNFTIDTTAPSITTSIATGTTFERFGGNATTFFFNYTITEIHWDYANFSFTYPNGTAMLTNKSSFQAHNQSLDLITLGVYTWVIWSNDTLSNYQKKTVKFTIELDDGGGGARTVTDITEEIEEGRVEVPAVELSFFEKNKTWLIVGGIILLVLFTGKRTAVVVNERKKRRK